MMRKKLAVVKKLWLLSILSAALILCEKPQPQETGTIIINSTPEGARVELNYESTGKKTNCVLDSVPVKPYECFIQLYLDGYDVWGTLVAIEANDTMIIDAVLEREAVILWSFNPPGQYYYPVYSSPAVASDGTIYFGCDDNYLYAVNSDSTMKWRSQAGHWIRSSPAIGSDGTIYFGCWDGALYAVDPSGNLEWKYPTSGGIYSSPAIGGDGTVYFGSGNGYFYAVDSEGNLKWNYEIGDEVYSSPAIASDGTIYFGADDGCLYAFDTSGALQWEYQTQGSVNASPAIGSEGTIYIESEDSYLYAITPAGELNWAYKTDGMEISSPAIGPDGTIYFYADEYYLYAITPSGSLKWSFTLMLDKSSIQTPAPLSPTIGADGTIYVGGRIRYDDFIPYVLYAISPDGSLELRYKLWGAYHVNSSVAITAGGTIYVIAVNMLYALQSESYGLANSPWPKFRHDNQNTGRITGP